MYYELFPIIVKICILSIFTTIRPKGVNDMTSTLEYSIDEHYEQNGVLGNVLCHSKELTEIFPFLISIDNLCVTLARCSPDGIDSLNLGKCRNIYSLCLKNSSIKEVPEYITSFLRISYLDFSENRLSASCFDSISQFSSLISLNLGGNLIEEIPRSILNLQDLKELNLNGGLFTSVPEFISELNLKTLYLNELCPIFSKESNKEDIIIKIINDFLKIKSLENLNLRKNEIVNLQFNGKQYGIKELDLRYNNIHTLHHSILEMESLESLDLQNNNLDTVPSILAKFKTLKTLNLQKNNINSYNGMLFHSLENLHITFDLHPLCDEFSIEYKSSPLKTLHIYEGPYSYEVFSQIYRMSYLKNLYLYNNLISVIDEEIVMLQNLEVLYIKNLLSCNIISSIFDLKNLTCLYLNLSIYDTEGFSETLFAGLNKLKKLKYLFLNDINGKSILDSRIFYLRALEVLELQGFLIEDVEEFGQLKCLKQLRISNSKFNNSLAEVKSHLDKYNDGIEYSTCEFGILSL